MRSMKNSRGITLIELMVIVTIIGIVSAMAFPRFSTTISRLRFKGASKDMLSTLRLARSNAIAHKLPFGVHFDADELTLTSFVDIANPALSTFESGDSVLVVDSLPEEFAALGTTFSGSAIIYNPNGTSNASGSVNFVAYTSDGGVSLGSLSVLASTGRTKLGDLYYY